LKHIRQLRVVALSASLLLSAGQWWCIDSAQAQQEPTPRRIVVILVGQSPQGSGPQSLRQGLRDAGYMEGRDVVLDWRSAKGDYAQLPAIVADIVRTKPDIIVVESTVAIRAVKHATSSIPIVMSVVADPVGSGFVESLARPGGNITGLSMMMPDILTKRLQLLKEAMPGLKRLGVLRDPSVDWHSKAFEDLATAAKPLGVEVTLVAAGRPGDFERAFSALRRSRAQALYLLDNAFFFAQRATILRLAAESKLPVASGGAGEWAEDGALLSYSADFIDIYRRVAGYVDKVLKGSKPKDLPIQQPTKFLLKFNLKTAKALGLKVPDSILVQADEVIQ
jgi:putative ABC transport system substrate-binding protein